MSEAHDVVEITQDVSDATHIASYKKIHRRNKFTRSFAMSSPRTKELSTNRAGSSSQFPGFSLPKTKSKHVTCVSCSRRFYVRVADRSVLTGFLVPLLLPCGHPICSGCVKKKILNCALCETRVENNDIEKVELNLYVLGLLISSSQRQVEYDNHDFAFCDTLPLRLRQIRNQGHCHECGTCASIKCVECVALFCSSCYSKIHRRALQNHTQILLVNDAHDYSNQITINCTPTCTETLSYFCNDCDVSGCSNCMLRKHKMHDYVILQEKNKNVMSEFNEVNEKILENLQRVAHTKQKLNSTLMSTCESEERDAVEVTLTKHFARLHGVLQNLELRLLNQLHQRRNNLKNNLTEIKMQLNTQEEQLASALMMASYVNDNLSRVDLRYAIKILSDMADLPCYLLYNGIAQDKMISSTVDESVIELLEKHCTLEVPTMLPYQLVRMEALPKDYEIESVAKDFSIADIFKRPFSSEPITPSMSNTSLASNVSTVASQDVKPNKTHEDDIGKHQVEIIHIVKPSLFFVRYSTSKTEFAQLEKELQEYAAKMGFEAFPRCLYVDDMCLIKSQTTDQWHRGRVIKRSDHTEYTIFLIDYGYEELTNITYLLNISDEHLKLPPQAIRCCLHGLVPIEGCWTTKSKNDLSKLLQKTPICMYIMKHDSDILHVDFCIVSSEDNTMGPQSVCNAMIFMKHAHNDFSTRMRLANNNCMYSNEELVLDKLKTVTINYIESPTKFYASKVGRQKIGLSTLLNELKQFYEINTVIPVISTPREGLLCGAQYIDGVWHRCEITKVISENKVKVFFIDIGCTLTLNCHKLRAIPQKYIQYKAQAIKISVMYVETEIGKWKAESVDMLSNIFNCTRNIKVLPQKKIKDEYYCDIILKNEDVPNLHYSLMNYWDRDNPRKKTDQNSDQNSDHYSDYLSEYYSEYYRPRGLEVSEVFSSADDRSLPEELESDIKSDEEEMTEDPFKMQVHIKRVVTPDLIYVAQARYEKSNANFIEAMQQFYNCYYSEPRDNWSENALCVAYSAKDKSYFRAQILKIKSPMEVLVYFCDMGIDEIVPMQHIQVLHPRFTKHPAHCFKAKLAGVLPCGGSSAWPLLSCSTLVDIVRVNTHCKFFITNLVNEEVCDNVIPVELWVRQIKIPGPLAPSQVEMNSVNRMLIEEGVALPIKDYFSKADKILTTKFGWPYLLNRIKFTSCDEEDVKWLNKDTCRIVNCKMDDSSTSYENELCHASFNVDSPKRKYYFRRPFHWLPALKITEEVFHAIPTYVDNNGVVYLHSTKYNGPTINFIEYELQYRLGWKKIKPSEHWQQGDLCIARYHVNDKWYRGKVLQVLSETQLQVEFVDYGNVEECDVFSATRNIKMHDIPIQCTKCIISGLSPNTSNGKWKEYDLDRLHMLLVDKTCKVCVLERYSTHLVVSITMLEPPCRNILTILAEYKSSIGMDIKIEPQEWNDVINHVEEDADLDSSRNTAITEKVTTDYDEAADTSNGYSKVSSTQKMIEFEKDIIKFKKQLMMMKKSECNDDKETVDCDNISWPDMSSEENYGMISSRPYNESDEEYFDRYKLLSIPSDTKYIEVILRCNKNPTTSYAQLAENNDDIFSNELHQYYLQYLAIKLDMQENASSRPLIEDFESDTLCVAKFTDDEWCRCVIMRSQQVPNKQLMRVVLRYIDYGNNECKILNLSTKNHDLRVPKKIWTELPAMVLECQFWNIDFVSDDVNLLASKLDEIYNKVVVARVKELRENILVAEIYENKMCQTLLYAHLIEEGLYQPKKSKED